MANIPTRKYHQGRSFEGKYKSFNDRKYIHAAADRFDEHYDMIRAVRDNQYKYLKNFNPEKPYYLPLEYREKMDSMQELIRMNQSGQLDNLHLQWFRKEKPKEATRPHRQEQVRPSALQSDSESRHHEHSRDHIDHPT